MLRSLSLWGCAAAFALFLAAGAGATSFVYECAPCGHNPSEGLYVNEKAGVFDRVHTVYDDLSERFTWETTFSPYADDTGAHYPNGGWLVVNAGGNPKNHVDELGILFIDGLNSRVTAYVYDGANGVNGSLGDANRYITTYEGGASFTNNGDGTLALALAIDATAINSHLPGPDWRGVQFDDQIGIWFHPAENAYFVYRDDGSIESFAFARQGWLDTSAQSTSHMPEPGAALVFSFGIGMLAARQRKLADPLAS